MKKGNVLIQLEQQTIILEMPQTQEVLKPLQQKESILQTKKRDNSLPQTLMLLITFL